MTTKDAFRLGFRAGRSDGSLSAREAYERVPDLAITNGTITAYLEGNSDGVANVRFRLEGLDDITHNKYLAMGDALAIIAEKARKARVYGEDMRSSRAILLADIAQLAQAVLAAPYAQETRCGLQAWGMMPPCVLPAGHQGDHQDGMGGSYKIETAGDAQTQEAR